MEYIFLIKIKKGNNNERINRQTLLLDVVNQGTDGVLENFSLRLSEPLIIDKLSDIYLDNSNQENGCIWGIPGHHLVGHVEIENFSEEDLFNHPDVIPFEAEPGDVIFHSLSAPHGSIGNRTKDLRRTFYIHFANFEVYKECYSHDPGVKKRKEEREFFLILIKNQRKSSEI